MKHIKIYEEKEEIDDLLNDLDSLSSGLTKRLNGWYVTYVEAYGGYCEVIHLIIKEGSEKEAVKSLWETITHNGGTPPKSFEEFEDAYEDDFGLDPDYLSPNIKWFQMTPKNKLLKNKGIIKLGDSPYKIVEELNKEFTDAKSVLEKGSH